MEGIRRATAKYVGARQQWRGDVVFVGIEKMPEHAATCCEALPKKNELMHSYGLEEGV